MALLEFYGEECPHCRKMDRLIERLEEEGSVEVTRLEVWHDEESRDEFRPAGSIHLDLARGHFKKTWG